tara:strand:- start:240 stop:1046 length:807 start_codon:yes stop_codon:yes gene_type:complete
MTRERRIQGLSLKISPLGENDRLITLLSDSEGITRFSAPGARRPKSKLSAATPLNLLELQVGGRSGLERIRQLNVIRSFNKLGESLETLAAAQAIAELSLLLVGNNDPQPGILSAVLIHLERLESLNKKKSMQQIHPLAESVQSCIHLLALGGYGIPIQECPHSKLPLEPPIGEWEWRCSFLPEEGFVIGSVPSALIQLNPSELALLQRLARPSLPIDSKGEIMGPKNVWLRLLTVVEYWIITHMQKKVRALNILRESIISSGDEQKI